MVSWSGRFVDPLDEGPLLEIPVNCESYNLAYVPAVLDAAGLNVPTTWAEYFSTARMVVERTGGRVGGFGQRGTGAWHAMYTGFATQFWSYGASDFEAGRCSLAAPESLRATSDFVAALGVPARRIGSSSAGTSWLSTLPAADMRAQPVDLNPTRSSIWDDERFREHTSGSGPSTTSRGR